MSPLRVLRWKTRGGDPGWMFPPLPDPMLALLGVLVGGVWAVEDEQAERTHPHPPGTPVCVHRYRWRLLQDGQDVGFVEGELEESGLNMPWSTYTILRVEAQLAEGRVLRARNVRRGVMALAAYGFTDEALRAAAAAVGLELEA